MQERLCHVCMGQRLKPAILAVTVADLSIMDICNLSIDDAVSFMSQLKLNITESKIVESNIYPK